MVLARPVGKRRSFRRGFALSILTAGLYAVYWNYRAPNELFRQFELQQEGRDEGVVWYILGILLLPLLFVYWWTMAGNVQHIRSRLLLPERHTQRNFVALLATAVIAYFVALIFALLVGDVTSETPTKADIVAALVLLSGMLTAIVLIPAAYHRMQRDINDVWLAYDARLAQLTAPPPVPAASPPPHRYYADLAPRPATDGPQTEAHPEDEDAQAKDAPKPPE